MKLTFDRYTLQEFHDQGIIDVHVWSENKGCAGQKMFFAPLTKSQGLESYHQDTNITLWLTPQDVALFDGGQIAVANGRIYFSSPKVQGRCGCGTSISFVEKTIDLSMSKIHRISEKLSTLPHIQKALSEKKQTR